MSRRVSLAPILWSENFFVFEETQLTLLIKQNKYIYCK